MRPGIEPGVEGDACLRNDRKHRKAIGRLGLLAVVRYGCATEAWPPPQVCVSIGLIDGQRQGIASFLQRDKAGIVLVPEMRSVEALGVARGAGIESLDKATVAKIGYGGCVSMQSLTGKAVFR